MQKILIAYVPVLHEGYRAFFAKHVDADTLFLFGNDVIAEYTHLIKDIRRIDAELIQKSINAWNMFSHVEILSHKTLQALKQTQVTIVFSNDDITSDLVMRHFPEHHHEADNIFLRWDKKTAVEPMQVSPDVRISTESFDREIMERAKREGEKSRDWWRRIGAIAVRDNEILFTAHNMYLPSEHIAYDEGDPRGNFTSGVHLESSLALHAEANIVAQAAKTGVSLAGTDIYTETFPCPPCAKQLACSGIKRLFYRTGYNVLDGGRILRSFGVEIIFVN